MDEQGDILDFGSGDGRIVIEIAKNEYSVYHKLCINIPVQQYFCSDLFQFKRKLSL